VSVHQPSPDGTLAIWLDSIHDLSCIDSTQNYCVDAEHQPKDVPLEAGSRLAPKHHILDRCAGEPECRLDTARDSAAARPHHPPPAVIPGIGPSLVGAMPGHHEPDASIRVSLLLPFQVTASAYRLSLVNPRAG
jgi:hypothetical protein